MMREAVDFLSGLLYASGIVIVIALLFTYGLYAISLVWRKIRFKRDWYYRKLP